MSYELFEQGPAVYIPIILISFIVTLAAYGAFPLIFAKKRKDVISKKEYKGLCYCINGLVMILFVAANGASSGGPYFLWTWMFSAMGINTLKDRGVLEGFHSTECPKDSTYQADHTMGSDIALECDAKTETFPISQELPPETASVAEPMCGAIPEVPQSEADQPSHEESVPVTKPIANSNTLTDEKTSTLSTSEKHTFCKNCGSVIDPITKKCSGCGKQYFRAKTTIPIVILSVLLVSSIALNVMLYLQGKEARETVSTQKAKIENLETSVSSQKNTISTQKGTIALLEKKGEYFDTICKELSSGNIGYASNSFKSSESIIVVDKDEKNRKFTLTTTWSGGGTVSVDYSGYSAWVEFDNDSWTNSTKMTVQPRYEGVTAVTFSNDVNSKTFKVLIIVTD